MENYFANPKKYNKILFKYLGYGAEVDCKTFTPEDPFIGFEILRWVIHKINHNPKEGYKMRTIISIKDEETEVFIQQWYDTTKADGYINVVSHKEVCEANGGGVEKKQYEHALLSTSHKAVYNSCVDYIIKAS